MGWKDRFVQGSFRGIPFQLEVGDDERAKRLIVHEFPGRDKPYIEEMGRKTAPLTIEAILLGDDYLEQRDLLQDACAKAGSGKLVHPFYGEMTVHCRSVKVRHDKTELRMVRVSMEFLEVGDKSPLKAIVNTQQKVQLSARDVLAKQKTAFEKAFDYASLPYNKAQSVLTTINTGVENIGKARALVNQAPAFAQMLQNIGGALSTLVLDAGELADEIINVITFGFLLEDSDLDETPDILQSFKGVSGLFQYPPGGEAAAIAVSSSASTAVHHLIRGASIAQGAHLLSLGEFTSFEDVTELKTTLFEAIDALQTIDDLDDELFMSLQDLVAQVERDITQRTLTLPRVVETTLPEFTPAFLLSYQLYGHIDQEQGILERNRLIDPGVVPSDVPIKVLSDG